MDNLIGYPSQQPHAPVRDFRITPSMIVVVNRAFHVLVQCQHCLLIFQMLLQNIDIILIFGRNRRFFDVLFGIDQKLELIGINQNKMFPLK